MLQFKSTADLKQLPATHPAYPLIQDLVARLIVDYQPPGRAYAPEDDGWIALIEESDVHRVLTEIWPDWQLADVEWEGITYRDGFWQAIYLADNEKGFVLVIPDEPWITDELRETIEFYLDP
ncbi:MAG: hypothetical protein IPN92_06100 [Chromatiaceae bacterium]|nr:hypothetical protein [Chromatiaceae bacterium]